MQTSRLRIRGRAKALATVEMILEETLVENLRTFEGFPDKWTSFGHIKDDVATYNSWTKLLHT